MRRTLQELYRPLLAGEKIEALFLFQAGTVWASMESVYKSCLADERFRVRLVWVRETAVEKTHMAGAEEFLKQHQMQYEEYGDVDWSVYCPHIVLIQFPYDAAVHTPETLSIQFAQRGSRVIYIPYGIEISDTEIARKDHFQSFVVENSWRIYTCCEGIKKEYDRYCRNRQAVRVTGSPKFDAVRHLEQYPLRDKIAKCAEGRSIVVWKMHFPKKIMEQGTVRQITPDIGEYLKFADCMEDYRELFFVVLMHPKMAGGMAAADIQGDDTLVEQVRCLTETLRTKSNVYIDTAADYRNSFYHANAIILDRSAVMVEAAMLDVPVLLMKNAEYDERLTGPVQHLADSFSVGTTCAEMLGFLEEFRQGKDPKAQERKSCVRENFPLADGGCGERIKEDIAAGLKQSSVGQNLTQRQLAEWQTEEQCVTEQPPRVVLYGTGEVCDYYLTRQGWREEKLFAIAAVADSDQRKWGMEFLGYRVCSPEEILQMEFDAIVIMTEPHYFEIKKYLVYDLYLDERKIWRLDEFVYELGRKADCKEQTI